MRCLSPNIGTQGRWIRGLWSLLMLLLSLAGHIYFHWPWWLCLLFLAAAIFCAFEALRGWCVLRACGIKTPL